MQSNEADSDLLSASGVIQGLIGVLVFADGLIFMERANGHGHLGALRPEHGLEQWAVLRAADAPCNMRQTSQKVALFSMTNSGRKWPFLESRIAGALPSTFSIDS